METPRSTTGTSPTSPTGSSWWTFLLAVGSGLVVWMALPPLGWWPLGWVAPVGWLILIQRPQLWGRRPYWAIYFASAIFWALTMQGIRLAHWANYLGLIALGLYLGIYLPIFVAVARVAYHRWRVSLVVVAPVAWVGVEVARGYGPLGFSVALLGHTQVRQLTLIQIADLCGSYTVSFVVMLVAACLVRLCPLPVQRRAWWPLLPLCTTVVLVVLYGRYRLAELPPHSQQTPLRVALIQGSIDTIFDDVSGRELETFEQYSDLTDTAWRKFQPLDLVVWPETMFPVREFLIPPGTQPQFDPPLDKELVHDSQQAFRQLVQNRMDQLNDPRVAERPTTWIFGASVWQLGDDAPQRYNAALLVRPNGAYEKRYYKMRPVIFGEYVPFGDIVPSLYNLFPLPNGLTPGTEPVAWKVGDLTLSPSICFESTMPHLLRWHVAELTRQGHPPDVLVNLTNDGWFWGSSILDMQLSCAVMRAVELRRPCLVAANTGLSAWIDGNGQRRVQGPRRACAPLLAEVVPDGRTSWYVRWGDGPALCCTLCALIAALSGLGRRWSERSRRD